MKITPEHFRHMRDTIAARFDAAAVSQLAEMGVTPMRLRWDLAHSSGLTPWLCANVYSYADDNHIDTALRAIMRELYATKHT